MALKKALARADNRVKGEFPDAYWRVMTVETKEDGKSRIRVAAFADAEARRLALDPTQNQDSPPHMRGPGENAALSEKTYEAELLPAPTGTYSSLAEQVKAASYVHLKAHADFARAEDC